MPDVPRGLRFFRRLAGLLMAARKYSPFVAAGWCITIVASIPALTTNVFMSRRRNRDVRPLTQYEVSPMLQGQAAALEKNGGVSGLPNCTGSLRRLARREPLYNRRGIIGLINRICMIVALLSVPWLWPPHRTP